MKSRVGVVATMVALSAVAVASAVACAWTYRKVRGFDAKYGCDVLAGIPPKAAEAAPTSAAEESEAKPKPSLQPRVEGISVRADSDGFCILVKVSDKPEPDDLLRYIDISPSPGAVALSVRRDDSDWWLKEDERKYVIELRSAGYAYRVPYAVTAKAGLPFCGGRSLATDFRRTVTRADEAPDVQFAHSGRYLPPVGDRVLAVETVNVTGIECLAHSVLPDNVVHLLCREEGEYEAYSWWSSAADCSTTAELALKPVKWSLPVKADVNCRVKVPVSLSEAGVSSNGVYLVAVRQAKVHRDGQWRYRLVCVSDLGLSVRRDGAALRVWVTSLVAGRPVEGAMVSVYASNGLKLCSAATGAGGEAECVPSVEGYEPFAVVVTDGRGDMSFMALGESFFVDETPSGGGREPFLERAAASAFVWTERGIYRHDEPIMVHAILRDGSGCAPRPMPVCVSLHSPDGKQVESRNAISDDFGSVTADGLSVPGYRSSGKWTLRVSAGGNNGKEIGRHEIKVEDFVPPQVKVVVEDLDKGEAAASNITFTVRAEHFFGGAAKELSAAAVVTLKDCPFTPDGWDGYSFGDAARSLKPNIAPIPAVMTDSNGKARFATTLDPKFGEPSAAVQVTVQGSVAETGGRAAYARASRVVHAHGRYVGIKAPRTLRRGDGAEKIAVAIVAPDGSPVAAATNLWASLCRIERAYNLKQLRGGSFAWECEKLSIPVDIAAGVSIGGDGRGFVEVPVSSGGEFELVVRGAGAASCRTTFRVVSSCEEGISAEMSNPTALAMEADKEFYREGDRPVITVKAPFRGWAHLSVMREKVLYTRVLELTNATSAVELEPLPADWAPNVEVAVSVVQSAVAGGGHLACRAHGTVALPIRPRDRELPVRLDASVTVLPEGGAKLEARIDARGECSTGAVAVVTVVDEAINVLTDEPIPCPSDFFATLRSGLDAMPLRDLFNRLLPIYDDRLSATGAKTGGDCEEGLMKRISPMPTRRFRPLSVWRLDVPLADGSGTVEFRLPEFSGEVRVTAVAYDRRATGSAAVSRKVSPRLVMQADAPRFVAPTDSFAATLVLFNRSGADGEVAYSVAAEGAVSAAPVASGRIFLKDGEMRVAEVPVLAGRISGEGVVKYVAEGLGETHSAVINVPVRPAVAWEEKCDVVVLAPGESVVSRNVSGEGALPGATRRTFAASASPVAELAAALEYLAEYPHGCLEQTVSRMFPLVSAGALLSTLPVEKTSVAGDLPRIVGAGISRVVSMMRANDFTMWPGTDCPPWDREVSAYAAHFLMEANASGYAVPEHTLSRVKAMLRRWALGGATNLSAYACHTLALCGVPEKDKMLSLYDSRGRLSLLDRARLARAFVRIGDPKRARELVADAAIAPTSVKEAAFAMLALLDMDSSDGRLPALAKYLQDRRDRSRFHWGTTGDNAHALLALAAYHNARGVRTGSPSVSLSDRRGAVALPAGALHSVTGGADIVVSNSGAGDAYVVMKTLALPDPASVTNSESVISVSRRFLTVGGEEVDMESIVRGDTLVCEISVTASAEMRITDLVLQDLLPACFEPMSAADAAVLRLREKGEANWILRSDVRDDRVLAYSLPAKVGTQALKVRHAVRVTSAGDFVLPGVSVEAMYSPETHARTAPRRVRVAK